MILNQLLGKSQDNRSTYVHASYKNNLPHTIFGDAQLFLETFSKRKVRARYKINFTKCEILGSILNSSILDTEVFLILVKVRIMSYKINEKISLH